MLAVGDKNSEGTAFYYAPAFKAGLNGWIPPVKPGDVLPKAK